MTEVSSNHSSNDTEGSSCVQTERKFDHGCLAPAIVIILILSCLKRRSRWKLEYCKGYPGLLIPINFLGGIDKINRYTIAITFGATASTFFSNSTLEFADPPWLSVFSALFSVLEYGILFYPFFACLTTENRLAGSLLGFLYATMRFIVGLVIEFQCTESYVEKIKTKQYIEFLGKVPTYLCLLFIALRFAVLLVLQIKQCRVLSSWHYSEILGADEHHTCLIEASGRIHVKQLLTLGSNTSRTMADEKWYKRLICKIYRPREDFKFSTQLISTLVVAGIIVFQVMLHYLSLFDYYEKEFVSSCVHGPICRGFVPLLFHALEGGVITAATVSILLMLHFMKCHRDNMLQMYRGQRTFFQDVTVSPANLVGQSLLFSGYQIAFVLTGYTVLSFFLAIIVVSLTAIFKYIDFLVSPEMLEVYKNIGQAFAPPICLAICLWLYQLFLTYYVFRDRDFPDITITVDNRRFYSIMSYFFFFYNILLGLFSCIMRILKGMILGVIFISRIDRTSLMQGFQTWDKAFVAYLGFIHILVAHNHPVMLMFCQLLINSNKDRQYGKVGREELPGLCVQNSHSEDQSSAGHPEARVFRPPHMSHQAINRWFLAFTLLRNPSLVKYRRRCAREAKKCSVSIDDANYGSVTPI